jgi:hypothetical protein
MRAKAAGERAQQLLRVCFENQSFALLRLGWPRRGLTKRMQPHQKAKLDQVLRRGMAGQVFDFANRSVTQGRSSDRLPYSRGGSVGSGGSFRPTAHQ